MNQKLARSLTYFSLLLGLGLILNFSNIGHSSMVLPHPLVASVHAGVDEQPGLRVREVLGGGIASPSPKGGSVTKIVGSGVTEFTLNSESIKCGGLVAQADAVSKSRLENRDAAAIAASEALFDPKEMLDTKELFDSKEVMADGGSGFYSLPQNLSPQFYPTGWPLPQPYEYPVCEVQPISVPEPSIQIILFISILLLLTKS